MGQIIHKPKRKKSSLDRMMYIIAFIAPVMVLPQIKNIWIDKNAAGVSLATWSALTFLALMWLLFSIKHKEKQLILYYFLALVVDSIVVLGLLLFR